jgi:hypothetical protein
MVDRIEGHRVAGNDALDGGSHTVADGFAPDVGDVESASGRNVPAPRGPT